MKHRAELRLGLISLWVMAGCSAASGDLADAGETADAAQTRTTPSTSSQRLSWYSTAQPILRARCVQCHTVGGAGPFALETLDDVEPVAALVRQVVVARRMPPMMADDRDCRELSDARKMPDAERAALVRWIDEGMLLGSPSDASTEPLPSFVQTEPLGAPDMEFDFGLPYASRVEGSDDYRCMIIDPGWTKAHHLRAVSALPDNVAMVHHVIVFAQLPAQTDAVDALDAADDGPGYECFGGSGFTGGFALGAYVPGASKLAFPAGATVTLPAGTRFVAQMHYNFLATRGDDNSRVQLWETDAPSGVRPSSVSLVNRGFTIPAGDPAFSVTRTSNIVAGTATAPATALGALQGKPGFAWGAGAHMHMRGSSARIDLLRADGSEECLLDIPRWDFHWQGQYRFAEPIELFDGDALRLTCTWDNSPENQPVVDSARLTPAAITWGEGTLDEMCLGGVQMTPTR